MRVVSGDQSIIWDAPLKLKVLSVHGHEVEHAVHTIDYFSRAYLKSIKNNSIVQESYKQDGNITRWTASCEYANFLGRMPIHPKEFTKRGIKFKLISEFEKRSVDDVILNLTAGDWFGLVYQKDAIAHSVKIGEILNSLNRLRRLIRENLSKSIVGFSVKEFDRHPLFQFSLFRDKSWGEAMPIMLDRYLKKEEIDNVTVLTSVDFDHLSLPLFKIFINNYSLLREIYNEAVKEGNYIDLLKEGELPFYALVKNNEILIREPLFFENGDSIKDVLKRVKGEVVGIFGKAIMHIIALRMYTPLALPEGGSQYYKKADKFIKLLEKEVGIKLCLNPILWIRFNALDSLCGINQKFILPKYLQSAFGGEVVDGHYVSQKWREVVDSSISELKEVASFGDSQWIERLKTKGYVDDFFVDLFTGTILKSRNLSEIRKDNYQDESLREIIKLNSHTLRGMTQIIRGALEKQKANYIRDLLSVKQLEYWNKRPFHFWVDFVPEWHENIIKNSEVYSEI